MNIYRNHVAKMSRKSKEQKKDFFTWQQLNKRIDN